MIKANEHQQRLEIAPAETCEAPVKTVETMASLAFEWLRTPPTIRAHIACLAPDVANLLYAYTGL